MLNETKKIELGENERKLLKNGWGKEIADETVTYKFSYNSDGLRVNGFLSRPSEINNKLPIIIWNRGGNSRSGLLDDFLACVILGEIASWGYVVFASQYRENDEFGGSDVNDVLNLIKEAKNYEYSNQDLIGMEGWSRGGMMSYLTLARTNEIRVCIMVAGLSDLISNSKFNPKLENVFKESFGRENPKDFERKKIERSAVYWPEKIYKGTKILFIHGTADEKILTANSQSIFNKLSVINYSTRYKLELIPGGDHYLRKHRKEVSILRRNWFDENLKLNA